MLFNAKFLKVIITTLTLTGSASVIAEEVKFKLTKVKSHVGIQSADSRNFNKSMNSCVELAKFENTIESEQACTKAIEVMESINVHTSEAIYLKSLSYSNRGISRYMNDDLVGAKADFIAATHIDSNNITKSNLMLLNKLSMSKESNNEIELAD